MNNKQSSVEWLAEKYNYVTWMRNRDEISAEMADESRKRYLEQAKAMHMEENIKAWNDGRDYTLARTVDPYKNAKTYYNETFKPE